MVTKEQLDELVQDIAKLRGWAMHLTKEINDLEVELSSVYRGVVKWEI